MRTIVMGLAAAALVAVTLPAVTSPAAAQVGIHVDTPGVGVQVGDPDRRIYREERRRVRSNDNRGDCRTITVRKERDDGTVITRQERRCD